MYKYIYIYIYVCVCVCTISRQNYSFIFLPCANQGCALLVVRISAFSDFEVTHAKQGYRYRVVAYR